MTPERWREIAELVAALVELDDAERVPRLASLGASDPALRAEVESLLVADGDAGGFLADPIVRLHELPGTEDGAAGSLAPGTRVGPYRLTRELGRGGMGVVYLAERSEGGFEQRVAIKLLKRGMDSEAIAARFQRERQILARLSHPNIAALLDGGVAMDGRPYFAMEYVSGEPITRHCDAGRLGVDARLRLVIDVCMAVQHAHAHAHLVVHRDLKPSNVLVDANGRVKLLDFGIAKLLAEEEEQTLSRLGLVPLTPGYAAPEQLRGGPITTSTDVYALGTMLFELLCGRRPSAARAPATPGQAPLDAPPPSLAAALVRRPTGGEGTAEDVAARRSASVATLTRRLRSDLDAVARKAIAPEPEARYASAAALAEDLGRHLRGVPVVARRPSLPYRAARFVRRHRAGVAAAALVVLATVAGAGVALWQAREAARGAARARAISAFVLGIFNESDPALTAAGRQATALEVVERGARRLETGLAAEPALRTDLEGVVGDLYRKLGAFDRAAPLLARALQETRDRYGERHPATVTALERWGLLLWDRGSYAAAEKVERDVLGRKRAIYGPGDPEVAATLASLASIVSDLGRYAEAAELHKEALRVDGIAFGADSPEAAGDQRNLGLALWKAGKDKEAEEPLRGAVRLLERSKGDSFPATLSAQRALAVYLSDQGRYDEAEPIFDALVPALRSQLGQSHPTLAELLHAAAQLKQRRGKLDEAAPLLREAVAIRRTILGPRHPDLAASLNNLATLAFLRAEWDEAETGFREALAIWNATVGPGAPVVASGEGNLGVVLLRKGDIAAAESALRESLELRRKAYGASHPEVVVGMKNLAQALTAGGKLAEADALLGQARSLAEEVLPAGHPRFAEILGVRAQLRLAQGDPAAAAADCEQALGLLRPKVAASDPRVAFLELDLARALIAQHRGAAARERLESAVTVLRTRPGYARDLDRARRLLAQTGTPTH